MKDIGIQEVQIQLLQKSDMEGYYTGAKRVSGLHDLLSHHTEPMENVSKCLWVTSLMWEEVDWTDQVPAFST